MMSGSLVAAATAAAAIGHGAAAPHFDGTSHAADMYGNVGGAVAAAGAYENLYSHHHDSPSIVANLTHQHPIVLRGSADPAVVARAGALFSALRGKYLLLHARGGNPIAGGVGGGGGAVGPSSLSASLPYPNPNLFPFVHYHER